MQKIKALALYAIPVVLMIGLIPLVANDYALAIIYSACIVALFFFKSERNDGLALVFGFIGITISEYFFVSTGVETFSRISFLGVMPIWLPFLWAYAFLTIKRSLRVLDS